MVKKYVTLNISEPVKNQLADIAKRHGTSIALLTECLLYIDDNALSKLVDKTKQVRQGNKILISKLAKLSPEKLKSLSAEELQRLLDSSSSS